MSMLPVPLAIVSLKVATKFVPIATPVASSAGFSEVSVGAVLSWETGEKSVPRKAKLAPAVANRVAEVGVVPVSTIEINLLLEVSEEVVAYSVAVPLT